MPATGAAHFYQEPVEIVRGDRYDRAVIVEVAGVDFSGALVEIHVRETPTGALLYDAGEDATLDTATSGEIAIAFTLPGVTTDTLPDRCVLDVRVTKSAIDLGPLTVVRLHLRLSDGYVQD
jgi:hypothetical protein